MTNNKQQAARAQSFNAVLDHRTRVLILGSMPGRASLQQAQYYAHPRNGFWLLMESLFSIRRDLPYSQRLKALNNVGIGLWDVFAECEREGSLDSAIRQQTARCNDFAALFAQHPAIAHVFFNGQTAAVAFERYVLAQHEQSPVRHVLPSTSPANATMSFDQKRQAWQKIRQVLDYDG